MPFTAFCKLFFHLYPEDKFHHLIGEVTKTETSDERIYKTVQNRLPGIKPFLSELTYALPALKTQKKEMTRQMLELLPTGVQVNGYVEIGSPGRYISDLRKHLPISGPVYLINDVAPTNSPADIMERGQLGKIGTFVALNDYAPISPTAIADESVDLVTCLIGLHHTRPEKINRFSSVYPAGFASGGLVYSARPRRENRRHGYVRIARPYRFQPGPEHQLGNRQSRLQRF